MKAKVKILAWKANEIVKEAKKGEFKEIAIWRFDILFKRASKGFYLKISFVYEVAGIEIIEGSWFKVTGLVGCSVNPFQKKFVNFTANTAIMQINAALALINVTIKVIPVVVYIIPLELQVYLSLFVYTNRT